MSVGLLARVKTLWQCQGHTLTFTPAEQARPLSDLIWEYSLLHAGLVELIAARESHQPRVLTPTVVVVVKLFVYLTK